MTLDLPLTETATLLQSSLQRYLADHPQPDWSALAQDIGLMSLGVPETCGGIGGGGIERAAVMVELGNARLAGDWLSHAIAAAALTRIAPTHPLLAVMATGTQRAALVTMPGHRHAGADAAPASPNRDGLRHVAGAAAADWLLVMEADSVWLIAADDPAVSRTVRPMHDGSVTADLAFAAALPPAARLAEGAIAAALAEWASSARDAALCAAAAGLMAQLLDDTRSYLGQRQQFGVAIASFQVLRHRLADMQMARMKAAALTERAITAEGASPQDWVRAIDAAAIETIDAVRLVGEGAVQLHGAMGLTAELALGGRFKRALAIAAALGPVAPRLARHRSACAA